VADLEDYFDIELMDRIDHPGSSRRAGHAGAYRTKPVGLSQLRCTTIYRDLQLRRKQSA